MSDIIFHNIKNTQFEIFGLYNAKGEELFRRLPESVAAATSQNVLSLSKNTSGGRVRFHTDADCFYIRAKSNGYDSMYHTTPLMYHGFDVYIDGERGSLFMGADLCKWSEKDDEIRCFHLPKGEKDITVNMPLYGLVYECEIGLPKDASLSAHAPYINEKPIVFYGSSITQGACASRPGKSYQARISRKYNVDYLNLGFSGSAKAEDAIVDYMSDLDMWAFVSDYDHNAPDPDHLQNTHYKLYEKIREKHPDIPYFMITKPDFRFDADAQRRRTIVMKSYIRAYDNGDRNVYFIDGSAFFLGQPQDELTMDRCHPCDEGMARMADSIGDVLSKVLKF